MTELTRDETKWNPAWSSKPSGAVANARTTTVIASATRRIPMKRSASMMERSSGSRAKAVLSDIGGRAKRFMSTTVSHSFYTKPLRNDPREEDRKGEDAVAQGQYRRLPRPAACQRQSQPAYHEKSRSETECRKFLLSSKSCNCLSINALACTFRGRTGIRKNSVTRNQSVEPR